MKREVSLLISCVSFVFVITTFASLIYADSFEFKGSNDKLEINETFGNVLSAITSNELSDLKSGEVTTNEGSTNYNQYIRFRDPNTSISSPKIMFTKSGEDVVRDFLFIGSGATVTNAFFEYELVFTDGLDSEVKDNTAKDYIEKIVTMFNQDYKIIRAKADTSSKSITLELAAGAVFDIIKEGDKKTYSLEGKNYEIELATVESKDSVRIKINGQEVTNLKEGEKTKIDDKMFFGISSVLVSTSGPQDMVKFYLASTILSLEDSKYDDSNFDTKVSISNDEIDNSFIKISASDSDSGKKLKISSIKYRLATPNGIYVKTGEYLSAHLSDPLSLFGNWDIKYDSLDTPSTSIISLTPSSNNDEYKLKFTNTEGLVYDAPFVSNKGTFKLGDDDQDLVIVEGSSSTDFNVNLNDYFVLTDSNTKTGTTRVLKYEFIDTTTNTLKFQDLSAGQKSVQYGNSTVSGVLGEADLNIGPIKAKIYIQNGTNNSLAIALDGDDSVNGEAMDIVTKGGGIIDPGSTNNPSSAYTLALTTQGSQFEESTSDQTISFNIESITGNKIGLQSSFTGVSLVDAGDNHFLAMSDYGIKFDLYDLANSAESLTINYPMTQAFAKVFIELKAASQTAEPVITSQTEASNCSNNIQDSDETGIDCGGSCPNACPTCSDAIQNQDEQGVDCGGPCEPCQEIPAVVEDKCPLGCLYIDENEQTKCLDIGTVVGQLYCDKDKSLKLQRSNGQSCTQNYECKINICENNKCGKEVTVLRLFGNLTAVLLVVAILYYAISLFSL